MARAAGRLGGPQLARSGAACPHQSLPRDGSDSTRVSSGTAWAISRDGLFVTNHHVVEGAKEIRIGFEQGKSYSAHVLLSDPRQTWHS